MVWGSIKAIKNGFVMPAQRAIELEIVQVITSHSTY